MTRSYLIDESFVEHASFRNLLLFFFEHCVFDHELHKITHILRAYTGSATLELDSYKGGIFQYMLDKIDVREPELEVEIKRN